MCAGMSPGKHSISSFAQNLVQNAALFLHAYRHANQLDAALHLHRLVHRNALQVDVNQLVLDGLILPVDDHGLGARAGNLDIKNGVVAGLGPEDPLHLLGIEFQCLRRLFLRRKSRRESCPATRTRRAAFLLNFPSRGCGCNYFGCCCHLSLSFGHGHKSRSLFGPLESVSWPGNLRNQSSAEERADAGFHVDALNRGA